MGVRPLFQSPSEGFEVKKGVLLQVHALKEPTLGFVSAVSVLLRAALGRSGVGESEHLC